MSTRGVAATRLRGIIHAAAAASPRLDSTEHPRRSRGPRFGDVRGRETQVATPSAAGPVADGEKRRDLSCITQRLVPCALVQEEAIPWSWGGLLQYTEAASKSSYRVFG